MRILSESASVFYSPFLALPAPKIAGLLPVPKPPPPPPPVTFTYQHPSLDNLAADKRDKLLCATQTLLDVALAHHEGRLNTHALNTALAAFRLAVTGQPIHPTNPAQFSANRDIPFLEIMMKGGV